MILQYMKESVNTVLPKNEILSKKKHGRHWRGPPKAGCELVAKLRASNGGGRAPRNPASATVWAQPAA